MSELDRLLGLSGIAARTPVRLGLRGLNLTGLVLDRAGRWLVRLNRDAHDNAADAVDVEMKAGEELEARLAALLSREPDPAQSRRATATGWSSPES